LTSEHPHTHKQTLLKTHHLAAPVVNTQHAEASVLITAEANIILSSDTRVYHSAV